MLGLLLDEFTAAESRFRVDKFIRTESSAALLTLVTVCALCTTTWTCTGDVTICKEGLCLLVIVLFTCLLDELALIIKLLEEV